MKNILLYFSILSAALVLLNSCDENNCIFYDCEIPYATEIKDIRFTPEKEVYSRSDTVLMQIIHTNVGDTLLEYRWSIDRGVLFLAHYDTVSQNRYKISVQSKFDTLQIRLDSVTLTEIDIFVNVKKPNHDSDSYGKPLRIKQP